MQHQLHLLLVCLVFGLSLFYGITVATALTSPEIAQIALDSTVLLVIERRSEYSFGSGFVVRQGQIATNYHVIEGIRRGYAKLVGETAEHAIEAILAVDVARDLAIVKVSGIRAPALPLGDSNTVQIGAIVYVAGNPQGLEGTFSEGIISAIRPEGNSLVQGTILQMTAPISPGSSGGPVLNDGGQVIGISVGQTVGGQNLNYAIPVNYLKPLITIQVDDLRITEVYDLYSGSLSVAFSPDGRYIATGDTDGNVGLWEVSSGENIYYKNLGGEVRGVAFSPDGTQIAADGANGGVRVILLDTRSATEIMRRDSNDEAHNIHSVAFSPDGRYVATGVDLQWAYLWEMSSGRLKGWGRTGASEVYAVAFSPDGRYLATGNDNGDLDLWEVNSWWTDDINVQNIRVGGNVRAIAFSPDGKYLAADGYDGSNTNVTIYDVTRNTTAWRIDTDIYKVYALAFSPNGEYLAVGGDDERITFYSIGADITEMKVISATGQVNSLAWSPDGSLISDGRQVWKIVGAQPAPEIVFESQEITDSNIGFGVSLEQWNDGNSNGIAEVGEQVSFIVRLRNVGDVKAINVTGVLSADDNSTQSIIVEGEVDYDDIGVGELVPNPFSVTAADMERHFKFRIPPSLTTRDATFTLTVTADNGGPWTIPLTVSIINPSGIDIEFPEDLITQEALGPETTYFILTAKYPELTGVSDVDIDYEECTITIHIPKYTEPFIFPIKTRKEREQQQVIDVISNVTIFIGGLTLPILGPLVGLLEVLVQLEEWWADRDMLDLKIELPQVLVSEPGRPTQEAEFVVLLKNTTMTLAALDITIEQKYRRGDSFETHGVKNTQKWRFNQGWEAPAAHPWALSDYPPFQLLPIAVQQYLLAQFSEIETAEGVRIPDETIIGQNYPNPFNPETWIPYRLALDADVKLTIYDIKGALVRQLELGHQPAGYYTERSKAAYWDGRNEDGELVASGVYFYQLRAGRSGVSVPHQRDYTALRRMVIVK